MNSSRPAFATPVSLSPLRTSPISSTIFLSTRPVRAPTPATPRWTMGKMAKFGPFSPIVILSGFILGNKRLNKIRGKAIALHSQTITAFCTFTGTGPKMRTALIRQAKQNGDILGFLS